MSAVSRTLDVFIPEDRRQALARGESLPSKTRGAVMFADLSGFTRLMSTFAKEYGVQRGAEALAELLDPIYAELVHTVHAFRGSVIVISGDGIICWFDQDDGRRALTCAFVMQKIMSGYESTHLSGDQTASLGLKIALSVGEAHRFLVGDPGIQLLEALAGHEVDRVVSIHETLEKGDVAIPLSLLRRFESNVIEVAQRQTSDGIVFAVVRERAAAAEPDPWPDVPPLNHELTRQWVHLSVYNRIEGGEIKFLTELRQAVPVFVKFTGIQYDEDEQAGEKLDHFVRCLQSVLERYEGYLCQLTIGGRDTNAYMAFGAPIAHEDNVDRALAAAIKLREETSRLGYVEPIQIGLTHGQLWAGAHGGGAARTYSVIGSEVNLANRLMIHAEPGQILVSPHVAERATSYAFQQLSPINFKGIEKPMPPFLLLSRVWSQADGSRLEAIYGREGERRFLADKINQLVSNPQTSPAGVVIIDGEAGIGKSRLLADFMQQAGQMGMKVLYGEGDPVEKGTQFYGFRRVFETIFNLSGNEDLQTVRSIILTAIWQDDFLVERAPLLGEILPLQWEDNELTNQITGEARLATIEQVALGVLKQAPALSGSSHTTAIVLDDAQWLDFASWNLVLVIARELPSIFFVISMRPFLEEEAGSRRASSCAQLAAHPATHRLQLSSLTIEEASELIKQRLGVGSLPGFVLDFVQARSQGNPFFTEQIAYALRDAGIVHYGPDGAVINVLAEDLARLDFPATIQEIITSRIDRLLPPQQLTLKVASVIGRVFMLKMLESVHPARININGLLEQLSMLTQLGITDQENSSSEESYLFKHVITQEVIYGLLTFAQRKQLHCEIARWYENNHLYDQSPYYSRLAHHWMNGEVYENAIHFLDKAGEQSLELFSNEDVIRFISMAIELDERIGGKAFDLRSSPRRTIRRARWERMLGTANQNLGRLSDALKHQKEALNLLGHRIPQTGLTTGMRLLKEICIQTAHRIRRKPRQYQSDEFTNEVNLELAQNGLLHVLFFSPNVALLAWAILFPLNVAERIGLTTARAMGYTWLFLIATFIQNQRLAELYRRLAWEMVEQADRISLKIHIRLIDGMAAFVSSEWDRADEHFRIGMQLADQMGDLHEYGNLAGARAGPLFLQCKYGEALALYEGVSERIAHKEIHQMMAWEQAAPGIVLLMLGRMEDATSKLEKSLALLNQSADDKILTTFVYGALSLLYVRKGQYDRALESALAHEAKAPLPSASSIFFYYSAVIDATLQLYEGLLTGKVAFDTSDAAKVKRLTERIPKFLKSMKNLPANKAGVWLYKGIYSRLLDQPQDVIAALRKAVEFGRRFNQPYELARALLELGQHSNIDTSNRRAYLTEAGAIFERCKNPYDLNVAINALNLLTTASTD